MPDRKDSRLVSFSEASFPEPFASGLEFNAPVRGPWNIVHTGMLLPGGHLLYICPRGCLRGVIMTAAEMGAMERMSWVGVAEDEVEQGLLEEAAENGVSAIVDGMRPRPRVLLIYWSCLHKFTSFDSAHVCAVLQEKYPETRIVNCHMMPVMRKSGPSDDQRTRAKLYEALEPVAEQAREPLAVNIIANDRPTDEDSEFMRLLRSAGRIVRDLTLCRSFEDYEAMARSTLNVTTHPDALYAAECLERRLGQRHLHVPLCYGSGEIRAGLARVAEALGVPLPDLDAEEGSAAAALAAARAEIGGVPIAIDYTVTPRPLGLARLLTEAGFDVSVVYADAFIEEERLDFEWLRVHAPSMRIAATLAPQQRLHRLRGNGGLVPLGDAVLAIGQKAAYMAETDHFVNMVAGGGLHGFSGIRALAGRMLEAWHNRKDRRREIQLKGLGCGTCL